MHLEGLGASLVGGRVEHEVAGDLAAGPNEANNVGVEGQLPLQVHLLLEQLQGLCIQPYMPHHSTPLVTILYVLDDEVHINDIVQQCRVCDQNAS